MSKKKLQLDEKEMMKLIKKCYNTEPYILPDGWKLGIGKSHLLKKSDWKAIDIKLGKTPKKIKGVPKFNKPDYETAYCILMEYWDSLPDDEKKDIDRRLRKCGL